MVDALNNVTVKMPLKSFLNTELIFNLHLSKIIFHKKAIERKIYCLWKSLFKMFIQLQYFEACL